MLACRRATSHVGSFHHSHVDRNEEALHVRLLLSTKNWDVKQRQNFRPHEITPWQNGSQVVGQR